MQAARFSAVAQKFKQQSLNVRVFGYPSATQLDQDSFILFTQGVEMKVSLVLQKICFLGEGEGEGDGGSLAGVDRFVVCKLVNSALKISWIVDFYKKLSSLAKF